MVVMPILGDLNIMIVRLKGKVEVILILIKMDINMIGMTMTQSRSQLTARDLAVGIYQEHPVSK